MATTIYIAIQVICFLLIALTPGANWIAIPLYVLQNLFFALVAGVSILVTSKQEGTRLVITPESGSWWILLTWYSINIVLAIPCGLLLFLLSLSAWQHFTS